METVNEVFFNSLYLLALINPISKICILSIFSNDADSKTEFNRTYSRHNRSTDDFIRNHQMAVINQNSSFFGRRGLIC